MQLTGQKVQQICDAIIAAYPTRDLLRMMVRVELDVNLEEIAGGENQSVVVFNVVSWAERNGRIDDLIVHAHRYTPGNPALRELATEWLSQQMVGSATHATSPLAGVAEDSSPASIDLFLCYSRKDSDAMHLVQDALRSARLSVWTDEGLEPGKRGWQDAIAEAVKQANAMVVLLSPDASQSTWVKNEIGFAQAHDKPIFPLLIAGKAATAVPIGLINVQWVDGRQNLSLAVIRQLLPVLRRQLAVAEPAQTFSATTTNATTAPENIAVQTTSPRVTTMVRSALERPLGRWRGAIWGSVLAAAALIIGGGLALNLLPINLNSGGTPSPVLTAIMPTESGSSETLPASLTAVTIMSVAVGTNHVIAAGTEGVKQTPIPSPATSPTTPPATTPASPLKVPTPAGDIRSYWAEGEAAYQDGDWQNALAFMTLARRIDPRYQGAAGDKMLFESHVGLAADAIVEGNLEDSLEHLDAAVALRPDVGRVKTIQAALKALVAPGTLDIAMARWSLVTALGSYAQELLDAKSPCAAAEQLQAAVALAPVESSAKLLAETQAACEKARRDADVQRQLAGLAGRLLYSTQEGDAYRIYRVPAALAADSALLIDNGSQPARQWHSNVVAFHSTQSDSPGIALFDPSAGLAPTKRILQAATSAGDAHDAPPSWSEDDRSLVYANTAPDGRTRIYRTEVPSVANAADLGPGRDPSWSPEQDQIVFNGTNDQGGEPGLWLMNGDGSNRQRLTDNGNDIRPVWTPDGSTVVFMSSRDGNWEIYRLNLLSAELSRLTTNSATDGLPTVSPDGKWVAFASDRGGSWRIWVTPLDGGDAQPLIKIEGVLTNWLEHAIQWTP